MEPIRYGVVGLGRAGWGIHVLNLRSRADAKIMAVVDPVAARREEAAAEFNCATYQRLEDMLGQADVEVAVIATPSQSHGPDAIRSLEAGKHVVVEKPMAMNVAEVDRMIASAGRAGKKLFVHHNYRFRQEFTHLQQVLAGGQIGRLFHIRVNILSFSRRNDWQTLSRNGGGLLNNAGSHFLDMVLQLLGAPVVQVMGDLQQIASAGDVEDHVKVLLRAANGVTADLEISTAQNLAVPPPRWVLCGTCGTLASDGSHSTLRYFDPAKAPPLQAVDGAVATRDYSSADKLPWQEQTMPSVGPNIGGFYDNVTDVLRRGGEMYVTPQSVREVIRVIGEVRSQTKFAGQA